jgi:hypothetical protein
MSKQTTTAAGHQLSTHTPDTARLDGRTFLAGHRSLHAALRARTLLERFPASTPSHWLLNLEDVELVRLSQDLPGQVLWLSGRPPALVAGRLLDQYRGGWLEGLSAVIDLGGGASRVDLLPPAHSDWALELLARLVVERWMASDTPATHNAPGPASRAVRAIPAAWLPSPVLA